MTKTVDEELKNHPCRPRSVAIFRHRCDGLYGVIALTVNATHNAIGTLDMRRDPAMRFQSFGSPEEAGSQFESNVAATCDNGWKLLYNSRPNFG